MINAIDLKSFAENRLYRTAKKTGNEWVITYPFIEIRISDSDSGGVNMEVIEVGDTDLITDNYRAESDDYIAYGDMKYVIRDIKDMIRFGAFNS